MHPSPGDDYVAVTLSSEELSLAESVRPLESAVLVTRGGLDFPGPTIVAASLGFERLTGYGAEEVVGRSPRILQGSLTDHATLDRLRTLCARGERFEGETVNYRKNGEAFLLHWCIDPIRAGDGTITHFMAVQEDVTDHRPYARKWLEAETKRHSALSQASEQLAAIAETILVLEKTKQNFRSSQLAELRRRLVGVARQSAATRPGAVTPDGAGS